MPAVGSVEVPVLDAVGQVVNQRLQWPADVSGLHLLQQHAAVWLQENISESVGFSSRKAEDVWAMRGHSRVSR